MPKSSELAQKAALSKANDQKGSSYLDVKIAKKKKLPESTVSQTASNTASSVNMKPKKGLLSSLIGKVDTSGHSFEMSIPKKKPRLSLSALTGPPGASLTGPPPGASLTRPPPVAASNMSSWESKSMCGWGETAKVYACLASNQASIKAKYGDEAHLQC